MHLGLEMVKQTETLFRYLKPKQRSNFRFRIIGDEKCFYCLPFGRKFSLRGHIMKIKIPNSRQGIDSSLQNVVSVSSWYRFWAETKNLVSDVDQLQPEPLVIIIMIIYKIIKNLIHKVLSTIDILLFRIADILIFYFFMTKSF